MICKSCLSQTTQTSISANRNNNAGYTLEIHSFIIIKHIQIMGNNKTQATIPIPSSQENIMPAPPPPCAVVVAKKKQKKRPRKTRSPCQDTPSEQ